MKELELAPGLLLSMPQLSDPHFSRAVVLMLDHGEEGSFGLIVNHPSDLALAEMLSQLEVEWMGAPEACVWSGGPVMPSSGWMLHSGSSLIESPGSTFDDALESTGNFKVTDGLYMTTSEENIKVLAEEPPTKSRFIMGYSGWAAGQLAQEMAQGSWLHAEINTDILFNSSAETMWADCLQHMGIDPKHIVQSSGVH